MTRHKVILAFGSNTADRRMKVSQALQFCSCHIDIEKTSPAVETEPVGLESPMFVNQTARGATTLSLDELTAFTKYVEESLGRKRPTLSNEIHIDIDIMLYDGKKLHENDWQKNYITTLIKHL